MATKSGERMRQEEMDAFFKKASQENYRKIQDIQADLERAKLDGGTYNSLLSKLNIMEQDVIDLKNRSNTKLSRLGDNLDLTKAGDVG